MTQILLKELINYHCAGGWGKDKEFDESELVNVIRGTDFGDIQKGNIQSVPCRFEKKSKIKKCLIQEDDILIEISGGSAAKSQSVGRTLLVTKEILDLFGKNVIPASFCRLIRLDKNIISAPYIYYQIKNLYKNKQITIWEKQSTGISNFQFTDFINELFIDVLDFDEYRNRIFPLEILDKKIELNQKMNETLEEIAKTLFKSWFVDFDPVRAKAEGRPTGLSKEVSDLFPDSFEESKLGRIPKEWDIISISELVTKNTKSINTSNSEDFFEHFSIPAFDDEQQPVLDQGIHIKSNKTIIESGSLLVSKLNPDNPRIWIPKIKEEYQQICSTEFMVFTPSELTNLSFIWGLFTSSKILGLMCSMVTGTSKSHQRVRPNDVLKITSIKPNQKLIHSYGIFVEPILQKIMSNKTESKILSKIRDLLLPKLISGELEIPDAENLIEEAGI